MTLKVLSSEGYPSVRSSGYSRAALYANALRFSKTEAFSSPYFSDEDFSLNPLLLQNLFTADNIAETVCAKKWLDKLLFVVDKLKTTGNAVLISKINKILKDLPPTDCPKVAKYIEECIDASLILTEVVAVNLRETASYVLSELKQIEHSLVYRIKDQKKHSLNRKIMRQNLQASKISAAEVKALQLLREN